ncbi:hypothetical protein G6F46_011597 [Rhizopus delemar]|uniref:Uncharacterized protein n=3 Tax=Rhizopus TaxID=4842 RepID=I1CPH6_RHIO9|nr:hypothetical protein RO3G_15067 [Rhizopus delemar RA 99-880]KAG1148493.1 hypothetical protein G6F36_014815 [Rhizopus arrhizus]KAG1461536.1 hypothetical protein G6F55_003505 [Rhizopus delemar]KAG1494168.1 hypothetical protein G6F53_012621 [Rhizopus delemar]KAG1499688.1 hypothetical protein G6F54_004235 [Rhizopus delemar]|eukprot:EIE90356.1 hypothetical protein RO3G_15067 [Rhizopus delemar RA 99-880]
MRLILALFGLLSAFMLVFSLPLENSVALEKRQGTSVPAVDPAISTIMEQINSLLGQLAGLLGGGGSGGGAP